MLNLLCNTRNTSYAAAAMTHQLDQTGTCSLTEIIQKKSVASVFYNSYETYSVIVKQTCQ